MKAESLPFSQPGVTAPQLEERRKGAPGIGFSESEMEGCRSDHPPKAGKSEAKNSKS